MISREISLSDMLRVIKAWKSEADNPRNDGWVQKGYEDKLRKIFYETGKLLKK